MCDYVRQSQHKMPQFKRHNVDIQDHMVNYDPKHSDNCIQYIH